METKGHDCYLANRAWLKGRDNQDQLATWHKIFQRTSSPTLEFCKAESCLDDRTLMCECDSMLHDNWLDIPYVVIPRYFFASNLKWLVTKIPEGIIPQLYLYAHLTKAL